VWSKRPASLISTDRDIARNGSALCRLDAQRALQEAVIERMWKPRRDGVARTAPNRRHLPYRERDRLHHWRGRHERSPIRTRERLSVRITPGRVDDERVLLAGAQGPSEPFIRQNARLHAPRIEEHRVARVRGIPEVAVEGKKGVLDDPVVLIEQGDVIETGLARHRRRELDVHPQKVLRDCVGARKRAHDGRRRRAPVGVNRHFGRDRRIRCELQAREVRAPRIEREERVKLDAAARDGVLAGDGRRVSARDRDAQHVLAHITGEAGGENVRARA
jgi:hypothetical protein